MRTTLTLDPDVEAQLRQTKTRRGMRWKQLVNEALREGLSHLNEETADAAREPFKTREADLGRCRYDNLDNIAETLAVSEGEDHQ